MNRLAPPAVCTALIVTACSGPPASQDVGAQGEPVIGGRTEATLASAGYLVREGIASCSAVLVERDLVLTAGHCVDGHHDIAFGWGDVGAHPTVRSTAHAVHPRYIHPPKNGGVVFEGFDVALLRLEAAPGVPPATLGPAPELGRVRAVGYGATSYVASDSGVLEPHGVGTERRSLEGAIRGRNATEVFIRFDAGTSPCYGDSGGPLFTEDGTLVAVLSRFTEIGRCLPRDRSLMGFIRVDTMGEFFRHAHECLATEDVKACLREPARGLCVAPRFDNRASPYLLRLEDAPRGTTAIELGDGEERSLSVTPASDVELTLDTGGDARMRVVRTGTREPIAPPSRRVALAGGSSYELTIESCNGKAQSAVLAWHAPRARATTSTALR